MQTTIKFDFLLNFSGIICLPLNYTDRFLLEEASDNASLILITFNGKKVGSFFLVIPRAALLRCIFCAQGKVFSGLSSLITGHKRQRKECAERRKKKPQKVKNKMRIFENWNFCGGGQISRAARRRMHSSLTNQRAICSLNYDRFPPKNSS